MIHIIKHGKKCYKLNCPVCGCIWTFEKEDITTGRNSKNEIWVSINCPDCKKRFVTWDEEQWATPYEKIKQLLAQHNGSAAHL